MKIELLEGRHLLSASISGVVFYDSDVSQNQDTREKGLAGWTVYLDQNSNGALDSTEPTATTDRLGRYNFTRLTAGDYAVGVVDRAGYAQTSPGVQGSTRGRFHIKVNFNTDMTAALRSAFVKAARRWESVIESEPDTFDARATNNLLTIDAAVRPIDGMDGTLAEATPTAYRYDDNLPYKGSMTFDRDDIQSLVASGGLDDTILHEMAHVLGFGTIWSFKDLVTSEHNHLPRYIGTAALSAYNKLFRTTAGFVPVDGTGGDGTAFSHWDSNVFNEELMTGYAADEGVAVPLSAVTVGQFYDLGYAVDANAADAWNPRTHTTVKTTPLQLGAKPTEAKLTVADDDAATEVSFGYRTNTAPLLRVAATSATGFAGDAVTLSAGHIVDAEGDGISGVSFYRESNGITGLQTGGGGDTYIAYRTLAKRGVYTVDAPTDTSVGDQTFYATVSDDLGYTRRRDTTISLAAAVAPARPKAVVLTAAAAASLLVQWKPSVGASAYRIELYSDASLSSNFLVKHFNVDGEVTSSLIDGLLRGTSYFARVRGYNAAGSSAYTLSPGLLLA